MGLKRSLLNKALFYIFLFSVFYVIGEIMGWTPKVLKDLVAWFGANFLLISVLLISFMTFIIMLRLTSKPRRGQPT